jgi:hypothetical protein
MHLNASFTANQGMVYAANLVDELYSAEWPGPEPASALHPPLYTIGHRTGTLDPVSLAQRARNMYQNNAREGVYLVMYPGSPTIAIPWQTEESSGQSEVGAPVGSNARTVWPWPDQSVSNLGFTGAVTYPTSNLGPLNVFARGGFTNGYALWEGLDGSANVVCKTRTTFESVPSSSSGILQCFIQRNPRYDAKAIENVAVVAQQAAGAYPANYNDLGKILGDIWQTVSGVVKPALGWAAGAHIPIVSDVAGVLREVSNMLG